MNLLEKYKLAPIEEPAYRLEDYRDNLFDSLKSVINPDDLLPSVQEKIDEQTEILEQHANTQIAELKKQNAILEAQNKELEKQTKVHISNYEELYRIAQQQEKQIQENEKETIKNKIYNKITLAIAIISLLIAICAWLFPNIIGG